MDKTTLLKIKNNPKYQQLIIKRSRFAWTLSSTMLIVYYTFILLIAFAPEILGRQLGESVITLGIPLGIAIILVSFMLSGFYVYRANGEFDQLIQEIRDEWLEEA